MRILSLTAALVCLFMTPAQAQLFGDTKFKVSSGEALHESWVKADKSLSEGDKRMLFRAMMRYAFPRQQVDMEDIRNNDSPAVSFYELFHEVMEETEGYDTYAMQDYSYTIINQPKSRRAIDGKTANQIIEQFKAEEKVWLADKLEVLEKTLKDFEQEQVAVVQALAANKAARNKPDDTKAQLQQKLNEVPLSNARLIWTYSPSFPPTFQIRPATLIFTAKNNSTAPVKELDFNIRIFKEGQDHPDIDERYAHNISGDLKPGESREFTLRMNDTWWAERYSILTEPAKIRAGGYTMVEDNGSHGRVIPNHLKISLSLNDYMNGDGKYVSISTVRDHYRSQLEAFADPNFSKNDTRMTRLERRIPSLRKALRQAQEDMKIVNPAYAAQTIAKN